MQIRNFYLEAHGKEISKIINNKLKVAHRQHLLLKFSHMLIIIQIYFQHQIK
jgi:hypothetical protein